MIVGGSPRKPEILGNKVIQLLADEERFCYHRASEMPAESVREWLTKVRAKALAQAQHALGPLITREVGVGAIVAKDGTLPDLTTILASHMRIHSAEGFFYRDVFRDACRIPCRIVPAPSLDVTAVGKLATTPWGRDQKLAALAAWQVLIH